MKKFLSGLLVIAMAAGLFSGCGTGADAQRPSSKNPVTVTVWHYYNGAQKNAFDLLVKEFNETVGLEQGIIVEAISQGDVNSLESSVLDSVEKKAGAAPVPNIFAAYADNAYQVDQMGLLANLEDYLTEEELSQYIPSYLEEGRIGNDGGLKIFPTAKSTEIFMLNKTDWDKFAAENDVSLDDLATIEGVVETARKYYEWTDAQTPGVADDGKAFFGRDAMANYLLIGCRQMGVEIFSVKNGKVTFQADESVLRRIWDNYYVPFINGWFTAAGKFRSDDAKVGNLIALVGSTASASYFPSEVTLGDADPYPIETLVLPAPVFEGGEPYAVQQGAGMVVTKSTPQQEYASVEFLKWFTEEDRNLVFASLAGYLPVKRAANDPEKLETASIEGVQTQYTDLIRQTLDVALETTGTQPLYTSKAFAGGADARKVLEYALQDKAAEDRAAIDELVAQGMSRSEAVAQFDTDENFAAWFADFSQRLEATQKGE